MPVSHSFECKSFYCQPPRLYSLNYVHLMAVAICHTAVILSSDVLAYGMVVQTVSYKIDLVINDNVTLEKTFQT